MAEYIDRNELIKMRHGCYKDCATCDFAQDGDSWCSGELYVVDVLRAPAADVRENVKGVWMPGREISKEFIGGIHISTDYANWQCSNCELVLAVSLKPLYNFCPNCGADMRGDEHGA